MAERAPDPSPGPRPGEVVVAVLGSGPTIARCLDCGEGRVAVLAGRGKAARIPAGRVVAVLGLADLSDAGLEELRAGAARTAAGLALSEVWEVVASAGGEVTARDAAELAFGPGPRPEHIAAAAIALEGDDLRFRRGEGAYLARSEAEVEAAIARRRAEERRAAARTAAVEALSEGRAPDPDCVEGSRVVGELRDLVVFGDDAPGARGARRSLALAPPASGDARRRAFDLLVGAGLMAPDEPIEIERAGISARLPREAEDEAARLAEAELDRAGRIDLTDLPTLTVDTAGATDRDDALSAEELGDGRVRVWVHVTDAASLIPAGGAVDVEARSRMATLYTPDLRASMVPASLSEGAGSISPGRPMPAISVAATVDAAGGVADCEIMRSVVVSDGALDYAGADRAVGRGDGPHSSVLAALVLAAGWLRDRRVRDGAVMIERPDVSVRLLRDPGQRPRPSIEVFGPASACRRAVAEMMILCNQLAASRCAEVGLSVAYRVQGAPAEELAGLGLVPGDGYDPVAAYRLAGLVPAAELSAEPGLHHGLGVGPYLQATSPLRRYLDLAIQRQLSAHLAGADPPHSVQDMASLAQQAGAQIREMARVEAERRRYWMLRLLEVCNEEGRTDYEATVLDAERRGPTVCEITEFPMRVRANLPVGVAAGDRTVLQLARLNLWRRSVRFEPAI